MDHTELVEKYVNGDIDDTAFNAEFEKLDAPAKAEVVKLAKEAKPKVLEEMMGIRKERDRLKTQKIEAEKPPADFMEKFRAEQKEKAMKRFFSDKGVEEADQAVIRANFEKLDDGAIDAELIGDNLKRVFAYSFPDKLITVSKEEGERGAAEFHSREVGGARSGGAPIALKTDDPRVKRVMEEARKQGIDLTADEAARGLDASSKKWSGLKPLTPVKP